MLTWCDSGVVDQDVQWTIPTRREISNCIAPGKVCQLKAYVMIACFVPDALHGAFRLFPVAGDQHHLPLIVGCQSSGDSFTDGASGTGYQGARTI